MRKIKQIIAALLIFATMAFLMAGCGIETVTAAENEYKVKIDVRTTDKFKGLYWKYYVNGEEIDEHYIIAAKADYINKKATIVITFIPEILPEGASISDVEIEFFVIPKNVKIDDTETDINVITQELVPCNGKIKLEGDYGQVYHMKMSGELDVGYSILPDEGK